MALPAPCSPHCELAAYTTEHPNVTISVVNKDVEVLREDLVNTALAPESAPELVWTVADHVGPFVDSEGVAAMLGGASRKAVSLVVPIPAEVPTIPA